MEPVSFAVGIIGLAGLFSTCLDVLHRLDSWQDYGSDSRNLSAQFRAHKLRLEKWGQAVGLKDGGISDVHDKALDDPRIVSTVNELLSAVKDVCCFGDELFSPSELTPDWMAKKHMLSRSHTRPNSIKESKVHKLNWALRDKAKRITQVEQFASLVDILYNLVPIGHGKETPFQMEGYKASCGSLVHSDGNLFDRQELNAQFRGMMIRLQNEMEVEVKRDIHTWLLGGHLPNETYARSTERRIDGTCEWILSTPWFLHWYSHEFPLGHPKTLWVNAPAGFGKSILCAKVVDHLVSNLKEPVSHFFFSTDAEREDHFVALRTWLSQMMPHPRIYAIIRDLWALQQGVKATRHDITGLLRDIVLAVPGCTFILDGLDECSRMADRRDDSIAVFLEAIAQATAGTKTRLLIFSRDEPEIRKSLSAMHDVILIQHKITSDHVRSDIDMYSRWVVDRKLAKKTEVVKEDISRKLADRCSGQFLWIKLQEDHLRSTANQKSLQRIINSTPIGLEDAYERNWLRISRLSEHYRSRAFNILRWAAFSLRPLTVNEMAGALLVTEQDDEVLVDEVPDEIDEDYIEIEILKDCNSLLEIRTPHTEASAGMKTIHLAHFSVKEYLLLHIPIQSQLPKLNSTLGSSTELIENVLLAKMCLRYLNCGTVWDATTEQYQLFSCFRKYAAESWQQHSSLDNQRDDELKKLINALFDTRNQSWAHWKEWFDSNNEGGQGKPRNKLAKPHVLLLEHGADVSTRTESGRSPLWTASFRGDLDLVSLLASKEAILDTEDQTAYTPLNIALSQGHLEIVKILLNNNADIQAMTKVGWTPLHLASRKGALEIVKILIDKGAEINSTDRRGWTPGGHLEVVQLLLENDADINAATRNGFTALIHASDEGHLEVVRLLLDNGADIDTTTKDGWTALIIASGKGHLEVVQLLLEKDADIEVTDSIGLTALISASHEGHYKVVMSLLEKGADTEIIDGNGWTALGLAAAECHVDVVKLLLDHGAKIEAAIGKGFNALSTAAYYGHIEVIRLLLDNGADPEAIGNTGLTALNHASENGHLEVVKLLFETSVATIQALDKWGRTALYNAASRGQTEIVGLCLANNVPVDLADHWGSTCLFAAVRNGHYDVVKLLIPFTNIAADARDGLNRSLFWWAKKSGSIEVVEILLRYAESTGINIPREELQMEISSSDRKRTMRCCDVCLRDILSGDLYRACQSCFDFDICLECFGLGARCLEPSHETSLHEPDLLSDDES
ncbi:hypothetical protein N7451_005509 [Penicillium sp. IBT 35674x]|nr:hypothetical protein N7451_005509 [Penicillium sp. IBT 35674x]